MSVATELLSALLFSTLLIVIILISVFWMLRHFKNREKKLSTDRMDVLNDAFRTLGNEINFLREQLELKNRFATMGEISTGIAHQIRNNLKVISDYSKLLLKSMDENDNRIDMIKSIIEEVEGINSLIEELLKFSKHKSIERSMLNIADLIKYIVDNIPKERAKLLFQKNKDILIKANKVLLTQAIKDIIYYVIDVSDEVKIEMKETFFKEKEAIFIDISGKGEGLSKEKINKLFLPFYTTKNDWLELGLVAAQKIILAHGGNISVTSKKNEGNTFTIYLPKD
ncbi:MAG: ATP-binding protein [Thermodesulfovibrionales bacterium]|nr:ATP-binding protein [Thermodesulfovibrionales bacterium]